MAWQYLHDLPAHIIAAGTDWQLPSPPWPSRTYSGQVPPPPPRYTILQPPAGAPTGPLWDGLIGYFQLDQSTGNVIQPGALGGPADLVGPPTWSPAGGYYAGALVISPAGPYISWPAAQVPPGLLGYDSGAISDLAISLWIIPHWQDWQSLAWAGDASTSAWALRVYRGTHLRWDFWAATGGHYHLDAPLTYTVGQWLHIGASWHVTPDGTATLELYRAGIRLVTASGYPAPIRKTTAPLLLGTSLDPWETHTTWATIDDIRIFATPKSPSDWAAIAAAKHL